jgi:hypothetical protein
LFDQVCEHKLSNQKFLDVGLQVSSHPTLGVILFITYGDFLLSKYTAVLTASAKILVSSFVDATCIELIPQWYD